MTAKKGIKLLGEVAVTAMFKEYKQLDDLKVLGILDPDLLTLEQKKNSLRATNLIKLERDDKVLTIIERYFPGLSIEQGNKLNFLGMEIDFFEKGKFKIGTVHYLKNIIEELEEILSKYGESLDRQYPHPLAKWLFTTKPDAKPLEESKGDVYRRFVEKLLWVEKRSRPGIEPTV